MDNEKQTARTWRVSYKHFAKVVTEDGELVATCAPLDSLTALKKRAQLVSAAPELFAIAKRLAGISEGLNNGNSAAEAELERLVVLAREAVAKATGA